MTEANEFLKGTQYGLLSYTSEAVNYGLQRGSHTGTLTVVKSLIIRLEKLYVTR